MASPSPAPPVARDRARIVLRELRERAVGLSLPAGRVGDTHYWLVRDGRILGAVRLRHRLTDALRIEGGHIGYEVRPSERRKGHATRMLALVLDKARALHLQRVMVTCDRDNVASAKVIRANGGVPGSQGPSADGARIVQRHWIEL